MILKLDKSIEEFAEKLDKPIYVVGGLIRNYLISGQLNTDIDLCGAYKTEELLPLLKECGFSLLFEYKRTGTVVFSKNNIKYEYTTLRTESYYVGGNHTPNEVVFTDDIVADAKRRDFTCNAIYYDIKKKQITDPLNSGIKDVENRVLDTVIKPDDVFSSDGLRLMRLARFCGELSFTPTNSVIMSAEKNRKNIADISGERIYFELNNILYADKKYSFSGKNGHINALNVLNETGVINILFGIEKSGAKKIIESVVSDEIDRLSAFLYGTVISFFDSDTALKNVVKRLKPDKKTTDKIKRFLCFDEFFNKKHKKKETKFFIAKNYPLIKEYLLVKKEQTKVGLVSYYRTNVKKLFMLLAKMEKDGVPFSFADLKIGVKDILDCGVKGKDIKLIQEKLLFFAVNHKGKNKRDCLQKLLMHYIGHTD